MNLPFTIEEFMNVFRHYNHSIWPMQIIVYLLAMIAFYLLGKKHKASNKIIVGILAFFWIWMGTFYHLVYFTSINKLAYGFGVLFIIEGLLLTYNGVIKNNIKFSCNKNKYTIIGSVFILYAMIFYPIIGYLSGHGYPYSPGFGVAPCPTTIFTYGILLFSKKKFPRYLLWIPLLWSLIGTLAAVKLGITEDFGLLIAAVMGTFMLLKK